MMRREIIDYSQDGTTVYPTTASGQFPRADWDHGTLRRLTPRRSYSGVVVLSCAMIAALAVALAFVKVVL